MSVILSSVQARNVTGIVASSMSNDFDTCRLGDKRRFFMVHDARRSLLDTVSLKKLERAGTCRPWSWKNDGTEAPEGKGSPPDHLAMSSLVALCDQTETLWNVCQMAQVARQTSKRIKDAASPMPWETSRSQTSNASSCSGSCDEKSCAASSAGRCTSVRCLETTALRD